MSTQQIRREVPKFPAEATAARHFTFAARCGTAVLALVFALLPTARVAAQSAPLAWPEITRESKPWTRWWWLGSAVDSANLSRELRVLADAGFGGVEVTSIYGVRGQEHRFVPYLSDRWIGLLRHSAERASRLGMGLDMPPGSGWRMGGPDVPVGDASASLRIVVDSARGGNVSAEIRRNGEQVKRPAPGGAGNAVDVLSGRAVGGYLERFGERVTVIPPGNVRAFFHDSYEYTGDASDELWDAFRARRGYDLRRHLPALAGQGDPDVVARVKADYRQTVSEMLLANLLRPFTAWAHQHGGLSRNQAHGSPGNLLDLYAASDIPETEIFGPLGGSDADPLISKFASSAAHVAGKRLASAEAMTWLGEHFTVTLEQVKRAADQLFLSGINHLIYHGTAYSPEDAAWPGWLFYASTQFNPRNAFWRDLPALNQYVARVQSVLQTGKPDNDLLLYWPIHDNWHDANGLRMDFRVHDPRWFHEKPLGRVATTLWQRGWGFDYVSDQLLTERVSASSGRLQAGDVEYRAILVPRTGQMPVETLQRLVELARAGATVIFHEQLPADVPGLHELAARRARLGTAKADLSQQQVGRGRVLVGSDLEALLATAGIARERMVDRPGVGYIRRRHAEGWRYFVSHTGSEPVQEWIPLAVPAAAVVLMDPMSGRAGFAPVRAGQDGKAEVLLRLEPGASLVLRTVDRATSGTRWPRWKPTGTAAALAGEWRVDFVQGGPALPRSFRSRELGSWTDQGGEAERFAGTARYTLRFDAPATADNFWLDLGRVAESARVRLNGRELGTLFARPWSVETGPLRRTGNVLEVEVTNLSGNRIRDLDRRGLPWRIFHDINFVNIDYKPFDASDWPIRPSGLLGPVRLQPLVRE